MFILTTIESDIRVHPKDLNKPPLVAVTDVIEQQYLDKVIPDLGLPVTIYDVQNIGELLGTCTSCVQQQQHHQQQASATHSAAAGKPKQLSKDHPHCSCHTRINA